MVHLYDYVLVLIFLPVIVYGTNASYPTYAQCNPAVISSIQTYWKLTGKPSNVLEEMEQSGLWSIVHTSYDYKNSHNKCVNVKFSNNTLKAIFFPKNGDPPVTLSTIMEEGDDGVLKGKPIEGDAPEYRYKWYPIYLRNGVAVIYACSDLEGSKEVPLVTIMVSKNRKGLLSNAAVISSVSLLQGWGLNFKHNYDSSCLLKDEQ